MFFSQLHKRDWFNWSCFINTYYNVSFNNQENPEVVNTQIVVVINLLSLTMKASNYFFSRTFLITTKIELSILCFLRSKGCWNRQNIFWNKIMIVDKFIELEINLGKLLLLSTDFLHHVQSRCWSFPKSSHVSNYANLFFLFLKSLKASYEG